MPHTRFEVVPDDAAEGWFRVRQPVGDGTVVLVVRVRVISDDDGGLRIRELHIPDVGQPLTGNHLRGIPLAAIEAAIEAIVVPAQEKPASDDRARALDDLERVGQGGGMLSIGSLAERLTAQDDEPTPIPELRRGRKRPDDFYEQVAQWYREALHIEKSPTPYIEAKANVKRSTATSWIQTARKRGLLRGTQRGRVRA